MPLTADDRIKETTTTTGASDITLAGAVTNFRAFSAITAIADGDTVFYAIVHQTLAEWEVGYGTWHTGNTITRTRVLSSSNAGALVNFSAGTKDVFNDHTAMQGRAPMVSQVATGDVFLPPSTALFVPRKYTIPAGRTVRVSAGAVLEIK